ncbi:hypothetical protein P886_2809 [Alteromonadaceae bacterium 2753L.S.0a.02]|nr:hypothetical protein P886_2809 [Alteromonadaceae bacterium 2753L.S.0a.02]
MIIPPEQLTEEVLRSIVESFITREGTDYGDTELSLSEKTEQLLPQVIAGEVLILFDEDSESVNLIGKDQLKTVSSPDSGV